MRLRSDKVVSSPREPRERRASAAAWVRPASRAMRRGATVPALAIAACSSRWAGLASGARHGAHGDELARPEQRRLAVLAKGDEGAGAEA